MSDTLTTTLPQPCKGPRGLSALGGACRGPNAARQRVAATHSGRRQDVGMIIMVSPVRTRVPPLLKVLQNVRKLEGSGFVAGALCEQLRVEVVEEQALYEGTAASHSNLIEYVRKMFLDGVL
jgi:hypothetical protein